MTVVQETSAKNSACLLNSGSLHFQLPANSHARVLHQVRTLESPTRGMLRETLGMSQPSVTRHVRALIDAGLVEEREVTHDGERVGRPHTILGLDGRHLVTWGIHVGVRATVLTITDGAGRLIREQELNLPITLTPMGEALDHIAQQLHEMSEGLPAPACVGAAVSAHIDRNGIVTSREYNWEEVDIAAELSFRLGQPVHVGSGAAAMAAQELLSAPLSSEDPSSTLYFYAREVVNHAWIVNGAVHRPHSGTNTTAFHELARGTGLEHDDVHPLSGLATVAAAQREGVQAHTYRELVQITGKNSTARRFVDVRNDLLVDAITLVLDIVDPAALVLAGEAFVIDRVGLRHVVNKVRARRAASQLRISLASPAVTRDAARLTGVYPLWAEPSVV